MKLKGPYLQLVDNKPISWILIEVTRGQTPNFYEKSLGEGEKYRSIDLQEKEPIFAIIPTLNIRLMLVRWKEESKETFYEVQHLSYSNNIIDLKDPGKPLSRRGVPKNLREEKFPGTTYAPTEAQKEYYQTKAETLEQELMEALKPQEEIPELPACKDYSLNALIQGLELTPTQMVMLEKLEPFWFLNDINKEHIPYACQLILSRVGVDANIEQALDNQPTNLRQNFCWPENIVKNFNHDVLISDVIHFTYLLVNEVYKLHTNGEELSRPALPSSAYQRVGQFLLNDQLENHGVDRVLIDQEEYYDDSDNDPNLQQALSNSLKSQNPMPVEQNPMLVEQNPMLVEQNPMLVEQNHFFENIYNLVDLEQSIYDVFYPTIQLSLIAKWCEWILNLCRILDIYCLRLSNVGKEITKHQAISVDKKAEYNQKFFNSEGDFDDNIRDLYVSQLWKGR